MKNQLGLDNIGLSLVDTMMAAALMGGVALVSVQISSMQQKSLSQFQLLTTRDNIKGQLERYLSNKTLLKNTVDHALFVSNRQLNYCFNGVDPASSADFPECPKPHAATQECCEKTPLGTANAFFLIDPSDPGKTRALAGPDSQPVRYRIDGTICPSTDARCPIEAITRFVATCPEDKPKCVKAEGIRVMFEIRQNPNSDFPSKSAIKPVIGEMSVSLNPQL